MTKGKTERDAVSEAVSGQGWKVGRAGEERGGPGWASGGLIRWRKEDGCS